MATHRTAEGNLKPLGYEKVTGLSASKSLTVPANAKKAFLKVESQPVRWRDDGTDPTSTDGMLQDVGDEWWYTGDLAEIEFIETAASATLHVSYYRND